MSVVEFIYSDLNMAAKNADSASREFLDYSDAISRKVLAKLEALPGDDSSGYIGIARNAAIGKKKQLEETSDFYMNCCNKLNRLNHEAENADYEVEKKIETLADPYNTDITVKSIIRGIGNLFYDIFCVDAANVFSGLSPLADQIMDYIRMKTNDLSHSYETLIRDHFKYGDGQYAMNKIGAIGLVAGAAIGLVSAIALIGKAAVVIAAAAVVLGTAVLVFAVINAAYTFIDNNRAERLARQGKKGLAHYYGGTEGFSSYYKRHDMGDLETNRKWEFAGAVFDQANEVAKFLYSIVMILGALDALTAVFDENGKRIGSSLKLDNIEKNIQINKMEKELASQKPVEKVLGIFEKSDSGKGWEGWIENLKKGFKESKVIIGMWDFLDGVDLKDLDHISLGDLKIGTIVRLETEAAGNIGGWLVGEKDFDAVDITKKLPEFFYDAASVFSEVETKSGVWEKFISKINFDVPKSCFEYYKKAENTIITQ